MAGLDPFEKPPEDLIRAFKAYQKLPLTVIDADERVIDFCRDPSSKLTEAFVSGHVRHVSAPVQLPSPTGPEGDLRRVSYESKDVPGLVVVPSMLSPAVQTWLLDRLLHRDLARTAHTTNLHKHYHVPYRLSQPKIAGCDDCTAGSCLEHWTSFFNAPPCGPEQLAPLDTSLHRPLTMDRVMNRKLRWVTLGGQYDWTEKRYPKETPPAFPADVKQLVQAWFPRINPEAAIVNFYSPGDTLSLHRDVSEESDQGLVSLSLGLDALFVVGVATAQSLPCKYHVVRLRSGDAIYMSRAARYAWHGVPQVLGLTCPSELRSWPAANSDNPTGQFEAWRGWMSTKRVNLNVRQMHPQ